MGNRKQQREAAKAREHRKRVFRALLVTGALLGTGLYIHHEIVGAIAGGATAAFFDLIFGVD